MKRLISWWVIGRTLDILTTYVGITFLGLREANPIARVVFENSYVMGLIFLTFIFTTVFIFGSKYVIREAGNIGLFCLYVVVLVSFIPVINNLILFSVL